MNQSRINIPGLHTLSLNDIDHVKSQFISKKILLFDFLKIFFTELIIITNRTIRVRVPVGR